ncbi:MAG: HAMP domain-containing protein [Clostridiales bacterium]|nr:HAMP domain-containing protein [Clostridiales bacterium]
MKFLKTCKKIIFKLCGKARWLILAFVVVFLVDFLIDINYAWFPYINGVCGYNGLPIHEYQIGEVWCFAINDNGKMGIVSRDTQNCIYARFDLNTWEQEYCGAGYSVDNGQESDSLFTPYAIAMTDDGEIYAYRYETKSGTSLQAKQYTIIRISPDYKKTDEVFHIDISSEDLQKGTRMSLPHYHNGKVNFSISDIYGVKLYSIDTKTQIVSESDVYPTDPDGTYTARIIPVDGAFVFIRSDGNVYKVEFGKPMGESIYKFNGFDDKELPVFKAATMAGGKLYFAVDTDPLAVYSLEDGKLTKEFDIKGVTEEPGDLWMLDSYHSDGDSRDTIVLLTEKALITYSGDKPVLRKITVRPQITPLMYIDPLMNILYWLPVIGLVINLIIRKKTLLYKQLIVTIPVFIVLSGVIAGVVYVYADRIKVDDTGNDLNMICGISAKSLEGFDFSGLSKPDKNTGTAYKELRDKLKALGSFNSVYNFSVVYRADDGTAYTVASFDTVSMPMQKWYKSDGAFPEEALRSEVYVDKNVRSIVNMITTTNISRISAYGKIHDASSSGNYYLRVEADYGDLFSTRIYLVLQIFGCGILIMLVISLIFILSTIRMLRVIKKATVTVKSISEGDLSARVNYSSKDELGQICTQVNEMASSLETSFEEKDKTEKFYYKFVPEKFREYLGKNKLTDLSLGDASNRELTVLFCDIRSFSINSEMMTAKENFAFVNTIYGKAGPIVREHNGFIDKYIGDAVMALFEKADDAVAAGIDLYKAIVHDPETAQELNVSDINIGIGIHTGMAMIGIVGESERLSGTVISDTVNLSSRLESLTKQYNTAMLVSKDTVDRLSSPESLELRYLGMIQVAGVNEVKGVYEVLDCLKPSEKEVRSANASDFREALRLFQLGRRSDAQNELEKIASEGRNDYVTDMYLKYIKNLSPDDKGNVFRFVRK